MIGYFVEFPNDDVGPFATREDAEAYRQYEGNTDETQVFTSDVDGTYLDLTRFCPEALQHRVLPT